MNHNQWHYRIVKYEQKGDQLDFYCIHKVFFDDDGEISLWDFKPVIGAVDKESILNEIRKLYFDIIENDEVLLKSDFDQVDII